MDSQRDVGRKGGGREKAKWENEEGTDEERIRWKEMGKRKRERDGGREGGVERGRDNI